MHEQHDFKGEICPHLACKIHTFSDIQLVIYQLLQLDMLKTYQALRYFLYFFHGGQNKKCISAKKFPSLVWAGGHEAQINLSINWEDLEGMFDPSKTRHQFTPTNIQCAERLC